MTQGGSPKRLRIETEDNETALSGSIYQGLSLLRVLGGRSTRTGTNRAVQLKYANILVISTGPRSRPGASGNSKLRLRHQYTGADDGQRRRRSLAQRGRR